jgi:outer membrane protein assembly factor BamB
MSKGMLTDGLWNWTIRCLVVMAMCAVTWFPTEVAASVDAQLLARQILDATGVKGGLVVHIGCGDGQLTAELRANDSYIVHGLDMDAEDIAKARAHIRSLGLYGKVSVDQFAGNHLPYIDNLVDLIVAEDLSRVPMDEVIRALAPGGVAYIKQNDNWNKTVKPWPKEIDEWTHYLHDAGGNPVAHDSVIGPPRHLQWVGSPKWARHHDHMASMSALVSADGRLFYILDEGPTASIELPARWSLIARDAFNGTILWKRPIAEWHTHLWPLKSGPAQLPRRLVAVEDTVYVTLGINAPLTALDAATGVTIRAYEGTKATEEVILSEGILFLLVDEDPARAQPEYATVQEVRRTARETAWNAPPRSVMAVRAETGEILWRKPQTVVPLTMAADQQRVFFHDGSKIVCLDSKNGEEKWTSEPLPRWATIPTYFAPTLVVYEGVVLFAGGENMIPHRGGKDTMTALSAETGEILWTAAHPPSGYQSPEDIIVAGGLVWAGATTNGSYSGIFTGRDLLTGEIKNQFPPDVETHWFHHRCYRAKATDKYLLTSRTGIEFIDINANHWICHHWVRGGCLYGIMPCNGLIYTPPHSCACYIEAKQFGFNALAPTSPTRQVPRDVPDDDRLERGPAYGEKFRTSESRNGDWPMYRHDPVRSGFTKVSVPTQLEETWQTEFGPKLTSVVVAEGKLLVASVDTHTIHALDEGSGEELWSYTVGGRVDSPPTLYRGRVLFGSADGWVYCLRASDGELIWRFRAAPVDRRLTAFEQVESVWPVHGSVLIQDDVLYCVAGRSMFLDGGLRFLRLDPETGRKLSETILDDRDPETGDNLQMYVKGLNMTVVLPDVLSSDGRNVYMRSMPFDLQGVRRKIAYTDVKQQKGEYVHLFSPTGFLDGTWWHRSYWLYGSSMASGAGGYYLAGRMAPAGRILVGDDENIYGFGRKPQYYKWTTPMEYQLFATSKELPTPKMSEPKGGGSRIRVAASESLKLAKTPLAVEAWIKAGKGNGVIIARGGDARGYALLLMGGKPQFVICSNTELSSVSADENVVGKWVHLAGVLTADKRLQLYVNGELAGSAEAVGLIAAEPKQAMEIGADEGSSVGNYRSPFGFTGLIDEVRVYRGALSADEVGRHYFAPRDTMHFSFDSGDARDDSGNENKGRVQRAVSVDGKFGKAMKFTASAQSAQRTPLYVVKHHWSHDLPLQVRAMVLAGDTLFVAGPPDVLDEDDAQGRIGDGEVQSRLAEQSAALAGEKGAMLWAVSTSDGEKLAECKLDSLPEWDGIVAANGRLYFSTTDGKVICLGH